MRPAGRTLLALDAALAVWVVLWALLAWHVASEVGELAELSATVESAAEALEETGEGLRVVSDFPFVGDRVAEIAERVEATAARARRDAEATRESVAGLQWLLGLTVALVPTLPLLLVYVPLRVHWRRDTAAVRRALERDADDALLQEFFARRAALTLPYRELRRVSENPWRDLDEGRHGALADLELARLGVRRPKRREPR